MIYGAQIFEAVKYPTMTFRSTSIHNTTGIKDRYKITGDLTLHGVTKPVTMDLWYRGTIQDAMSKKKQSWISTNRNFEPYRL